MPYPSETLPGSEGSGSAVDSAFGFGFSVVCSALPSLKLPVCRFYLFWGLKSVDNTYFGLLGAREGMVLSFGCGCENPSREKREPGKRSLNGPPALFTRIPSSVANLVALAPILAWQHLRRIVACRTTPPVSCALRLAAALTSITWTPKVRKRMAQNLYTQTKTPLFIDFFGSI